jgi:polysaccharide export outer membrane protein
MRMPQSLSLPCLALLALLLAACASNNYMDERAASSSGSPAPPVTLITDKVVQDQKKLRAQRTTQDITRLLVAKPSPYMIERGDILSIVVWDHPELAGPVNLGQLPPTSSGSETNGSGLPPAGFVVDHDGLVQFPFAGRIKLAGLTRPATCSPPNWRAILISPISPCACRPTAANVSI